MKNTLRFLLCGALFTSLAFACLGGCSKEPTPDPADPNLSKNTGEPVVGGPDGPVTKPK